MISFEPVDELFFETCMDRVRTDLEKSLKMTLVLENLWNSKVQFVLELSLNCEKISLKIL